MTHEARLIAIADEHGLALGFAQPREELAAEARRGGRQITEYLANIGGRIDAKMAAAIEAFDEGTWSYYLSPSGSGTSATRLANLARKYAAQGSNESFPKTRMLSLDAAEAMFDWPIYLDAVRQSTEDCQSYGHFDPNFDPNYTED